jgi:hypothetical protein
MGSSASGMPSARLGLSGELTGRQFWARTPDQIRDTLGFATTYRGGPLAVPDAGPGPRPGDRAPDAPLVVDGMATDLFAVRRAGEWTALAFGGTGSAPDVPGPVQVLDADAVAADGTLREAYAATDGELVVIRPDGFVWSRSPVGALCAREHLSVS